MERLEPRNLLSIGLTILIGVDGESVGALITSDDESDTIWAFYDPTIGQVAINPDRECLLLDATITHIVIDAGGGDDVVHVRGGGGAIQFSVDGGPGNDTITGSNGHDWFEGGEGDDWLSGALGADYLAGGPGNDSLFGGNGGDILVGGEGMDEMRGGKGGDTVYADSYDLVAIAEQVIHDYLGDATPPGLVIDPNEVVTPPCPPECPPGWDE